MASRACAFKARRVPFPVLANRSVKHTSQSPLAAAFADTIAATLAYVAPHQKLVEILRRASVIKLSDADAAELTESLRELAASLRAITPGAVKAADVAARGIAALLQAVKENT